MLFFYLFLGFISFSSFSQQVAIPSYFYPDSSSCSESNTCYWEQLNKVTGIAIINPNSGSGANKDDNYVNQVKNSQANGIQILGYVPSKYSEKDINIVKADIDNYFQWYAVDGIFIDEVSNQCADIAYYQALYDYIKSKSLEIVPQVVLNPGTKTQECYLNVADILVTFEGSYNDYKDKWLPLTWENNYPSYRFWHLVYQTNAIEMCKALELSLQRNIEYIYVTDDVLDNPWGRMPHYWDAELAKLNNPSSPCIYKSAIATHAVLQLLKPRKKELPIMPIYVMPYEK